VSFAFEQLKKLSGSEKIDDGKVSEQIQSNDGQVNRAFLANHFNHSSQAVQPEHLDAR
jgi:hypothetical protein